VVDVTVVVAEDTSMPVDFGGGGNCVEADEVCAEVVEVEADGDAGGSGPPTVTELTMVEPLVGLMIVVGSTSEVCSGVGMTLGKVGVCGFSSVVIGLSVTGVGVVTDCWLVPDVN
jgi:hypothetical protein